MNKSASTLLILRDQIVYHSRLLIRMPKGIFSSVLVPVLLILAFHFVGVGNALGVSGNSSLYIVAGATTMGIVMTAYAAYAIGLIGARDSGVLKRLHGTPLPAWCYFVGRIVATVMLATFSSAVALMVARFFYNFSFNLGTIIPLLLTIALGALAWATIGTAITAFTRDVSSGQSLLSATYLPVLFLSGVFFPLSGEPLWMQTVAKLLPAQPLAQSIEQILKTHAGFSGTSMISYVVLVGWCVVGCLIALRTFKWESRT